MYVKDRTFFGRPTDRSTVVIYGNSNIVHQVLPEAYGIYKGYQGFNK